MVWHETEDVEQYLAAAGDLLFAEPGLHTISLTVCENVRARPDGTRFAWEGMGRYLVTTISKNDVHGVVAVAAFGALMTAVGAILADLAVVALDPRVRVSGS